MLHAVGQADRTGMRWLRGQARHDGVTLGIRRFSRLGEHGGLWIAVGLLGALVDRRQRSQWLRGVGSVAGAYLVNTSLKQVARRPRPDFADLPPLIETPGPLSFPSSHAASSTAAAVAYARLLPRWPLRVVAAAMAISRVHLGVHYPSDIAAGALIGATVARLLRQRPQEETPHA